MEEEQDSCKQSLSSLTQNLITLLKTCPEVEIDLSRAAELLNATKRRLYDVVNVLQGVGLVERCGRSKIKWASRKQNPVNALGQIRIEKEKELTEMSALLDKYMENMLNSDAFANLAWVSNQDVIPLKESPDAKLFALKGPKSLSISIEPNENGSHRMICHADDAPISWIPIGRTDSI